LIITIPENNLIIGFRFDLFITELLASSCDSYVSYHLKIPQIVILASQVQTWYHHTLGSHMNPAHVSTFSSKFAVPTNIFRRMANVYDYLFSHIIFKWSDREATDIGRKYFGPDVPDADSVMRNTSLVFVNGHYSVDLPKPMLPNFIDIGGIHLVKTKPLPKVCLYSRCLHHTNCKNLTVFDHFNRTLNGLSTNLQTELYTSRSDLQ